jgi:hypothetical protein
VTSTPRERTRPIDAVAGLLAAGALFIGFFELFYRPFRLAPAALILVLVSTIMSNEHRRLVAVAVAVIGVCFVIGAALTVITSHPLY